MDNPLTLQEAKDQVARMSMVYKWRFFKHWVKFLFNKDIADIWECEHYYHSKRSR